MLRRHTDFEDSEILLGVSIDMGRKPIAPRSSSQRSRITNGSALLPGVDGRSVIARRYRDLVEALTAEQAGPLLEADHLRIRIAASMQVHVEDLTARLAKGQDVPIEEMTRAGNGAIRALASLSPSGPNRRRQAPSGVAKYLAERPATDAKS